MENIPTRDEVTFSRRVLYGIAGSLLLLEVVFVNYTTHAPLRGWCILVFQAWPEPFSSFAGYLVSAFAFYLLSDAAVGAKLPTRHWWMHIVVALTLAAVLVAGMALYRMWFPPPVPGDWLDG